MFSRGGRVCQSLTEGEVQLTHTETEAQHSPGYEPRYEPWYEPRYEPWYFMLVICELSFPQYTFYSLTLQFLV